MIGLAAPPDAAAQAPADTAAVLLDVASQLEAEGRLESARVLYRLILERYAATPAATTAEQRLASTDRQAAAMRSNRSGRTELLVWSTLYGLWLGFAAPAALGVEDAEVYGLGLLSGGPAGFLLARTYANRRPLSLGQARAITFGGTWGTWQGYGWQEALDIGKDTHTFCVADVCTEYEEDSAEAAIAAMIVGGLAGITTGALLAGSRDISNATATVTNFGALWGTWYGFAGGYLLDLEDDALLAAALLGGDAALIASALSASRWGFDVGRARLISVAGVAGGLAGAGIDLLIQPESEKVAILVPVVTSALGLALGVAWTSNDDGAPKSDGGPDEPGAGALIEIRDGHLAAGIPLPRPTFLHTEAPGRPRVSPGLRFDLLQARFW